MIADIPRDTNIFPARASPLMATCPALAPRDKLPIDLLNPSVVNSPFFADFI